LKTEVKKVPDKIANQLISPFHTIVKVGNALVYIGRGSFGAIHRMTFYQNQNYEIPTVVANIGQYCQFNPSSELLIGGEHVDNEILINTFPESHQLSARVLDKKRISSLQGGPISIGNNVILSARTTILSGSKIGDNCLIAAGAVVKSEIAKNQIAGGILAKSLKKLKSPLIEWWNLDEQCIAEFANTGIVQFPKKYNKNHLRLVFDSQLNQEGKVANLNLLGMMKLKEFIPIGNFSTAQLAYFKDATNADEKILISDEIFDDLI
jgi:acetyltransferase-like isoleucine patch superfamily enzyme